MPDCREGGPFRRTVIFYLTSPRHTLALARPSPHQPMSHPAPALSHHTLAPPHPHQPHVTPSRPHHLPWIPHEQTYDGILDPSGNMYPWLYIGATRNCRFLREDLPYIANILLHAPSPGLMTVGGMGSNS